MSFLAAFALAVAVFVVAPFLAHRLRRRQAEEQPFPPARLVEATRPQSRRRARLEDRFLFATRAGAVLILAALGATPLVRCSRLSLARSGGGSVAMALVVDDSMSMRAPLARGRSRFARAKQGALELLASAREGDAIAVVLAGAPARIALAATTDLGAARSAIESLVESDRPTDLDGALGLARDVASSLPQNDRRIIVLSDLADGQSDAPPIGESATEPVWVALPELRSDGTDCAIMHAEQSGARVTVETRCGPGGSAAGREIVVEDGQARMLARAPVAGGSPAETTVLLPSDKASAGAARFSGQDAVASDDVALVLPAVARASLAVVADVASESVATGGAPVTEQALAALKLDVEIRPIPAFPDRPDDLAGALGVLVDDPPGLTPEQRRALGTYLDGGGVVLLTLGARAAAAPLGASFEPILARPIAWAETNAGGADVTGASGELVSSAASLQDLHARRRCVLAPDDAASFEPLLKWADGAILVARRVIGRGAAWVVTLPVSLDASDLALRPAFLALLSAWAQDARERESAKRGEVGSPWRFPGAQDVKVEGPAGPVTVTRDAAGPMAIPPLIGAYRVVVDGREETRVAGPASRELDLRPRAFTAAAGGAGIGEQRARVDVSGQLALALLAMTALEIALRLSTKRRHS